MTTLEFCGSSSQRQLIELIAILSFCHPTFNSRMEGYRN